MNTQEFVCGEDGLTVSLTFTPGLEASLLSPSPCLYLMKDGSVHAGAIVWQDDRQVLRTTNPVGGLHTVFDIPASQILGCTSAGPRTL